MQLDQKQNALNAKMHDMQDLKEFERASFEDPAITEKRLAREVDLKQQRLRSLEDELQQVKDKFPALELEMNELVLLLPTLYVSITLILSSSQKSL